jgi:hypothetical protein
MKLLKISLVVFAIMAQAIPSYSAPNQQVCQEFWIDEQALKIEMVIGSMQSWKQRNSHTHPARDLASQFIIEGEEKLRKADEAYRHCYTKGLAKSKSQYSWFLAKIVLYFGESVEFLLNND